MVENIRWHNLVPERANIVCTYLARGLAKMDRLPLLVEPPLSNGLQPAVESLLARAIDVTSMGPSTPKQSQFILVILMHPT